MARCTSGPLKATNDGGRTDLMVVRHDQGTAWDQPADLRMVLAEDPRGLVRSVRRNLVPGAQRGLFDKALRQPAHSPAIVGAEPGPDRPTNAYQLLRLLDHLDVNPTIDLIGFGTGDPLTGLERDSLGPRVRRADELGSASDDRRGGRFRRRARSVRPPPRIRQRRRIRQCRRTRPCCRLRTRTPP